MNKILVTILGRPPRTESGYRKTKYLFPEDATHCAPTEVLAWELQKRLTLGVGDRLIVLGTTGSIWDSLLETLPRTLATSEELEDAWIVLIDAVAKQNVNDQHLRAIENRANTFLDFELCLRLIPQGVKPVEQFEILELLAKEVNKRDQVTLDLSHGFRHLPMLVLIAAHYLEVVKGARVTHAYSSFYNPDEDQAEVFDLAGLLRLMDWYNGLAVYDHSGDFGAFSELLRHSGLDSGAVKCLKTASFMERTSREQDASTELNRALPKIRSDRLDPAGQLFRDELTKRLKWSEENSKYKKQRELAIAYLNGKDYLRATILAFEAFISKIVEEAGKDPEQIDVREEAKKEYENCRGVPEYFLLRALRNLMAHGTMPNNSRTRERVEEITKKDHTLSQGIYTLMKELIP